MSLINMTLIKKLDSQTASRQPLWKRLGWMAIIWGASVLGLFIVASVFKLLMYSAGMRTH